MKRRIACVFSGGQQEEIRTPACDVLWDWFVFSANIKSDLSLFTSYSHYKSNQHTRINEREDNLRRLEEHSGKQELKQFSSKMIQTSLRREH